MSFRVLDDPIAASISIARMTRIGLISDTHGLLRPQALAALAGCAHIVHAGDIGDPAILDALARIAPVSAVRGNNDREPWAENVPEQLGFKVAGLRVHLLHEIAHLRLESLSPKPQVVIYGHSHKPLVERRDGLLYVNPGSAGPRRFRLPVSVAELLVDESGAPSARIIELVSD